MATRSDQPTQDREIFAIEFPPAAEFVGTARLFASALARHFGCGESAVQDLKLAVSEACTAAIRTREDRGDPVRLTASFEDRLTFEVHGGGDLLPAGARLDVDTELVAGDSTEDMIRNLRVEVVRALFPDVEVVDGPDGSRNLRFSCERESASTR